MIDDEYSMVKFPVSIYSQNEIKKQFLANPDLRKVTEESKAQQSMLTGIV
jgi:hypothetical protein